MNTILVTGGSGFVGSHTCIELLKKGNNVCIIDSLINSSENIIYHINSILKYEASLNIGKLFFRKGDIRDKKFLNKVFVEFIDNKNPFDCVIHFAAIKSVEESVNFPLKYWDVNLNATFSLLEIMDKFKCNSIVYSSSATIYDPKGQEKLKEKNHKKPINPYGNTKLTIEKILEDLFTSNPKNWKIVNLRYFNPVGAHNSGLIGENPLQKPTNLFPIITNVAKKINKELFIYGNDWPTKDGTCIRDYIHVMDLADAHVAAIQFLEDNKPQITSLNIGTGKGTSVLEIVNKFIEVNTIKIPYKFKERRKGDAAYVVADNSLALKLLNWAPKRDINDMCIDTWRWVSSY